MDQAFIDQTITAVDDLCWVDARRDHSDSYYPHIAANLAWLDDVTEGTDY